MMFYCIHRREDIGRLSELSTELTKVDLFPIMVQPEPIDEDFVDTYMFNKEMNSLRETTIKIVKEARDMGYPYITIMEDDCRFRVKEYEMFQASQMPEDFDFIHLNVTGSQKFGMKLYNKVYRRLFGGLCCQYYIIGESIYDRYITLLEDNLMPIDEVTRYLHKKRMNSYVVDPMPVFHEANKHSTLRNKTVKY
jgi:hypothetical protein